MPGKSYRITKVKRWLVAGRMERKEEEDLDARRPSAPCNT
jgi:hypothetical protein